MYELYLWKSVYNDSEPGAKIEKGSSARRPN